MADAPVEDVPVDAMLARGIAVPVGPVVAVLLVWAFGLRAWWWALPLSIVLAIVAGAIAAVFVAEWLELDEPDPPPRKRKPPASKKRRSPRKAKVIDLATVRARRSKEGQGNG